MEDNHKKVKKESPVNKPNETQLEELLFLPSNENNEQS